MAGRRSVHIEPVLGMTRAVGHTLEIGTPFLRGSAAGCAERGVARR